MPSAPKWLFDVVDLFISKLPYVVITNVEFISQTVKKIHLNGDFKDLSFPVGCYIDFRVSDTEARRYTVAKADRENGFLEFIVHVHGAGSGSQFMQELKPGDKIKMNKPRTERNYYDRSANRFIVFGDETSLALACSFLPLLKQNNQDFHFYFELDDQNKNAPELLGLENYTTFSKNGSFRNEEWIAELPLFQTADFQKANFVLTGNAKSAQSFRKVAKGKGAQKTYLHGYWLEGKKGL